MSSQSLLHFALRGVSSDKLRCGGIERAAVASSVVKEDAPK
jgi:hypothetical protein